MTAAQAYVQQTLVPWFRYAVGVGALAGLLVPRSLVWLRRRVGSRRLALRPA